MSREPYVRSEQTYQTKPKARHATKMTLQSLITDTGSTSSDGPASNTRYRSAFRPGLFEGQTVIVTGGGSGLGRVILFGARLLLLQVSGVGQSVSDEIGHRLHGAAGWVGLEQLDRQNSLGLRVVEGHRSAQPAG